MYPTVFTIITGCSSYCIHYHYWIVHPTVFHYHYWIVHLTVFTIITGLCILLYSLSLLDVHPTVFTSLIMTFMLYRARYTQTSAVLCCCLHNSLPHERSLTPKNISFSFVVVAFGVCVCVCVWSSLFSVCNANYNPHDEVRSIY